ncbi:2-oxoglutarate dehydrogenase, E2 component, dihydrolipoamide succinyltransferase [Rhodothermus profundi]|uniref:Dihydrolipoamide acetyltransferase component of pyruvate dehydrogenase complex n=1 Tax=Rhodothermus profundi TaxID=633813 RepID=A0A1M6RW25_9BACT|nr:2-oxoglutarate dehydrogenase, E2 component, dihydrolipoamide succinyltransferase [Rhodothermus profundi]SHK36712.1 2-oxoglutarate dehydrogenase E2 component [Rhodothermus profundi]
MARVEVVMPKMGESITEGTVVAWLKQPGERVEADEPLLEIGTDKVDTEVPSPASGVLQEILVPEGETVAVGTVLAVIETEAEAAPEAAPTTPAPEAAAAEAPEAPPAQTTPSPEAGEGEIVEVVMPKMGESITEGTVVAWLKQPGERVEADEPLLEIGTDKVDTEVPSPASGVLQEILVPEGETVAVGTVLARIATGAPAATTPREAPTAPTRAPQPTPEPAAPPQPTPSGDGAPATARAPIPRRGPDGRFYSPLVRSIAEKEGLTLEELASIPGSGRGGRVTKRDVLQYLEQRRQRVQQPAARPAEPRPAAPPRPPAPERPAAPPPTPQVAAGTYEGRVEIIEMDRMRQLIAEHMVRSKHTSPHVTSFAEVDVTNLVRVRERNKERFEQREGVRLTYLPFFVQAVVEALKEHPWLNASVEGTRIIVKKDYHIGLAVALGRTGLVVPVIRNAGQKNLVGLAHAIADLVHRARNKQLQPDELQGGTFTITNVGSLGSLMGTPIINQPQVAILATGAIKKRPVVIEHPELGDVIAIRHMMYLSLSYDHRIIDGAMAASFLRKVTEVLESIDPAMEL